MCRGRGAGPRSRIGLGGGRCLRVGWRLRRRAAPQADARQPALAVGAELFERSRDLPPEQLDDCRVMWEELFLQPLKDYLEWVVDAEDMH